MNISPEEVPGSGVSDGGDGAAGMSSPPVPGPIRRWVLGARPRTLPAAVVPVAVGTAIAWSAAQGLHKFDWWKPLLALLVALAMQVGTNYANDYSDGIRGTDERRAGPIRLVGSKLASPRAVKLASFAAYGVAAVAGLILAATTSWWLVPVGIACIVAGWHYTGGPKPYGYLGLGELFVFIFFGLVATLGTIFVAVGRFPAIGWPAGAAVGLLATALLEANNLRDIKGDTDAAKRTLAVRLGRRRAGWLYVGSLCGVAASVGVVALWRPWALLAFVAAPLAIAPLRLALGDKQGRDLLPMLGSTGRLQLTVGLLLVVGVLL